ncbi:tlr0558 [Thermosynechococcus vestitus BP-1]|uniref:Tlr0558 protein n=1 Tax=Thermosynechococcus vestitus (strain NIES-2133 / IAM M-273 / BP-1) TaxID=197221 RepID=Q8DLD7_THEVB|nr:hypothetical protein [Thermosynechococcus vestitus]BAC08110.1 tlr0558 [Thermosynechococcus vestitus BP-1]
MALILGVVLSVGFAPLSFLSSAVIWGMVGWVPKNPLGERSSPSSSPQKVGVGLWPLQHWPWLRAVSRKLPHGGTLRSLLGAGGTGGGGAATARADAVIVGEARV